METSRWLVEIELTHQCDMASFLRVTSVLHTRAAQVEHLEFDRNKHTVTVLAVTRPSAGPHLEQALLRCVDVVRVSFASPTSTGAVIV